MRHHERRALARRGGAFAQCSARPAPPAASSFRGSVEGHARSCRPRAERAALEARLARERPPHRGGVGPLGAAHAASRRRAPRWRRCTSRPAGGRSGSRAAPPSARFGPRAGSRRWRPASTRATTTPWTGCRCAGRPRRPPSSLRPSAASAHGGGAGGWRSSSVRRLRRARERRRRSALSRGSEPSGGASRRRATGAARARGRHAWRGRRRERVLGLREARCLRVAR